MTMDIGISKKEREKNRRRTVSRLLADSYTLYLKTHNFHWNVTGPMFNTLHVMFMGQYTELWNALDLIAERIRALGFPAPGTYREFVKLTVIKESEGKCPTPTEMLKQLAGRTGSSGQDGAQYLPGRGQGQRRSRRPTCSPSACRFTKKMPGCCAACSITERKIQ